MAGTPGNWSVVINSGAQWGPTDVSYTRNGVTVIPTAAVFTIHSPAGALLETLNATIDAGGVMTIPALTAAQTAALSWSYGNLLLKTTETGPTNVVDLLAGNVTVVNRAD